TLLAAISLTFVSVASGGPLNSVRHWSKSPTARLNALPISAQAAISSAWGGSRGAFVARRSGVGWRLAGGGVHVSILGGAVGVSARGGSLVIRLARIGHGARLQDLGPARIRARGNRVAIDRGVAREWYAAGPLGIEQGFTVVRQPVGGRGQLNLALRVAGAARGVAVGSSVRFSTRAGRVWLRIGGLVAAY